jgi:hypothetical protein
VKTTGGRNEVDGEGKEKGGGNSSITVSESPKKGEGTHFG